jgi:DNA-binding response OmpR family regulator
MRVLVVERDELLADFLRGRLVDENFNVEIATDRTRAEELLRTDTVELLILDLSLNEGLELLRRIRSSKPHLIIIVLGSAATPADCVVGLEAGADDYLSKPFSCLELIARIRAMLRRRPATPQVQLKVEDLLLDRISRTVQRGRHRIELTQKEFTLLEYLMERPFQPVAREVITEHAFEFEAEKPTNLVAVYINYLRKKVDAGFDRQLIHTIRGVGYQIGDSESAPSHPAADA